MVNFYVLLTVHPNIMIVIFYQPDAQILYFNAFITFLYMFRELLCSSSGGQLYQYVTVQYTGYERTNPLVICVLNSNLNRVTIPDAVLTHFDLLKISTSARNM